MCTVIPKSVKSQKKKKKDPKAAVVCSFEIFLACNLLSLETLGGIHFEIIA